MGVNVYLLLLKEIVIISDSVASPRSELSWGKVRLKSLVKGNQILQKGDDQNMLGYMGKSE